MTPTEQIRAALESKGWIAMPDGPDWLPPGSMVSQLPPDLLHSLDACHEVFEKDAPDSYWGWLWKITGASIMSLRHQQAAKFGKAICAQRIEAYLRDKGLWKE